MDKRWESSCERRKNLYSKESVFEDYLMYKHVTLG